MRTDVFATHGRLASVLILLGIWAGPAGVVRGQTAVTTPATERSPATVTAPASTATSPASTATSPASQPETGAEAPPTAIASLSIQPAPATDEDIQERLALVDRRLAELLQVAPTASAPASQPGSQADRSPAQRLYEVLAIYRSELLHWQSVRKQIKSLKSREDIEKFTRSIQEWKERQTFYASRRGEEMRIASAEHVAAVQQEYSQFEARLADLTAEQAAIGQQLTSLNKQRDSTVQAAGATLNEAKQFLADLPARLNQATASQQREALLTQKRVLEWSHNLQLLRIAAAPDLRSALELQQQRNVAQTAALADYVKALREYRNRLDQVQSQTDAQYAAAQLARKDLTPWETTYWQAVLHAAEGLQYFQELDGPTRSRFTAAAAEQYERRILRGRSYWQSLMESIDRRPESVLTTALRRLAVRLAENREESRQLQQMLDQTLEEQRVALDRQDLLLGRSYELRRRFNEQIEGLQGEALVQGQKLQAELTGNVRARLTERTQSIATEQQAVLQRLKKTIALLKEDADTLSRYRSALYWQRLTVQGRSLFSLDWRAARGNLREAASGRGLVGDAWSRYWRGVNSELQSVSRRDLVLDAGLVLAMLVMGLVARRRWLRRSATMERAFTPGPVERPADFRLPVRQRFAVEIVAAAGRIAPVAFPLLTALGCAAYRPGYASDAFTVVATVLLSLLAARAALAWVHANLACPQTASRLVPCTDAAAAYHQRWLRVIVLAALVTLPGPVFLKRAGLLPDLSGTLMTAAVTLVLALVFVYVARRKRFLGLAAEERQVGGAWPTVLAALLPVLALGVLALIGLAVGGYAALAFYIMAGVAWSVLVLWTAVALWALLHSVSREGRRQLDKALTASDSAEVQLDPAKTSPLVVVGLQLASVGLVVLAVTTLLYGWGIGPVDVRLALAYPLGTLGEGPVQVWRVLAAGAAIAASVIISRSLRAFLQSRVFPKATNVSRGGQAAILTVLNYTLVALGGYSALLLMNLRLGALAVLLGTLGLGLGLGLQPLFVNFISGLLILFERQIKIGDLIMVNDQLGEVTAISTRSTKIRTPDNIELDIPNAEFVNNKVVNWSQPDMRIRGQVEVGVAYSSDAELVQRLLLNIAQRSRLVLSNPAPAVWFMKFGESSLDFSLVCWFANPAVRWEFLTQVRYEILKVFREQGIDIPFPQRTISILGDKPLSVQTVEGSGPPAPRVAPSDAPSRPAG